MSDKAKNSCIERTVYVSLNTRPGDSVRYGNWRDKPTDAVYCETACGEGCYTPWQPMTIIEAATGSDYSGTLVEISNARCLKRDFPWLVEVYGGHGTRGVAYLGKRENQSDALIEAIDALADYPLYDEQDHSDLGHEKEHEAWCDDGREGFKRALVKYFDAQYAPDEHDTDLLPNDAVDAFWYDCTERLCGGEAYLNESGDSIYFPIDRVIEKIEHRWPGLDKPAYDGTRPSIDDQLVALAEAATVTDDTQPEQGA